MKVRYAGESFGAVSLTNGKVYECIGIESFPDFTVLHIIDDSDEDYLYSPTKPAPLDGSSPGGRWEIVEDDENGSLAKVIRQ